MQSSRRRLGRAVLALAVGGAVFAVAAAAFVITRTSGNSKLSLNASDAGLARTVIDKRGPNDPWMKSVADIDGDGKPDTVVAGSRGPIVWYHNPDWTPSTISADATSESGSATGDVDGDGDVDVVVGAVLYENRGRGREWASHTLGNGGTHDIVLGDFDGDRKLDVAMRGETGSRVDVFFQDRKDAWTPVTLDPGFGRNGLDAGDLDGDGQIDLVVGGYWLANPGGVTARTSSRWTIRTFADWSPWAAVRIAEMNGDGRPDVVLSVSEEEGDLAWFEGPRDPSKSPWLRHTVGTGLNSVHSVDVADMNGDRMPDVAASEFRGAGRLMLFLSDSAGAWATWTIARGENLHNTRVGDVNRDSRPDVLGAAPFGEQPILLYQSHKELYTRVLVFSRTLEFRHDSIPYALERLRAMATANGFTVDSTENPSVFTSANLSRYRAVVFLNPSGDVLDAGQRAAFQRYIQDGGGFVGVHNAAAYVLEDWAWYTALVGARYQSEVATQLLRLRVVDRSHASTTGLPNPWLITEEAYNWDVNPKTRGVTVLVNLDESFSKGGTMGADHPFSWYRRYGGGRSWYTVGGANQADYDNPNFMRHLLGGIRWSGGFDQRGVRARVPN
jgi:type 1 glutamine amidotransferase